MISARGFAQFRRQSFSAVVPAAPNTMPTRKDFAPIFRQDPLIREVLERSCFDCHSNEKPAAWNARLAPSYLFGTDKARRVLNFSDWDTYDSQRQRTELEAIGKVVADSSMPPGDDDFVRPAAKLSGDQKQMLLQWVSRQVAVAH
jgi:hypothetical protein